MTREPEPSDSHEPEPSSELRVLYRRLQPPALAEEVDDCDPQTARVVAWMRGAWNALSPPHAVPQLTTLRPDRQPRMRQPPPRLGLAAAAIVLALAGAALWREYSRTDRIESSEPPVRGPYLRQASSEPEGALAPDAIQVLATRPDRLELRSGPVRMVLLDPPTRNSDPHPGS